VTPQSTATRIADDAPEQVVPRPSGRVVLQPERFMCLGESSEADPDVLETDPWTYNEALQDRDAESWQKAMKSELESMDTNQVWDLVEPPSGVGAIGCNWVYKRKRGSDGKVETFKTRLFTRLAAFVPDLVHTEAQRAQRFIDGLYPAVRHNIVGHGTQTYARAVSIAQEVDASLRREAVRGQSSSVPPVPALPSTQPPKNNKRKDKGAQTDKRARRRLQQ
ncbi:cysteine-rich RLK (RECEPTOR-like protein kinase) 8, partial [Striga hermonthica]